MHARGISSGLGFAVAQQLACKGAKVYLAARNESKAAAALTRLEAEGLGPGNGKVVLLKLDLSDPKGTQRVAREFLRRETQLDILGMSLIFSAMYQEMLILDSPVNNAAR